MSRGIDPTIFLSRPTDLTIDSSRQSLETKLNQAAKKPKEISIISGYYGSKYISELISKVLKSYRKKCLVRLVFGVDHSSELVRTLDELRELRRGLIEMGFRNPVVALWTPKGNAPLHTKLYHFVNGTQPSWFVGSANVSGAISGDRHELMVRISGRHDALQGYLESIVAKSPVVEDEGGPRIEGGPARDRRDFFRAGSICYSPRDRIGFTFLACDLREEHRRELGKRLSLGVSIPYADARAEGFGFSLQRAVTGDGDGGRVAPEGGERLMARFRHLAIETSLGFWIPGPYAALVEGAAERATDQATKQLLKFAQQLATADLDEMKRALEKHVSAVTDLFAESKYKLRRRTGLEKSFEAFVATKLELLSNERLLRRQARRLCLTRTPDFWGDQEAVDDFELVFFESVAIRLGSSGNTPHIIGVLQDELHLKKGSDLGAALDRRLRRSGWAPEAWRLPKRAAA